MIKSHLLYQLSYRGEAGRDSSEFDFGFHFDGGFFLAESSLIWKCRGLGAKLASQRWADRVPPIAVTL